MDSQSIWTCGDSNSCCMGFAQVFCCLIAKEATIHQFSNSLQKVSSFSQDDCIIQMVETEINGCRFLLTQNCLQIQAERSPCKIDPATGSTLVCFYATKRQCQYVTRVRTSDSMDYHLGDSPEIKDCPPTDQYRLSISDLMDSIVSQIGLQCLWDGLYIAPTDKTS